VTWLKFDSKTSCNNH